MSHTGLFCVKFLMRRILEELRSWAAIKQHTVLEPTQNIHQLWTESIITAKTAMHVFEIRTTTYLGIACGGV